MSLVGASRTFFGFFEGLIERFGWQKAVTDVLETGILSGEINDGHVMKLYRWRELEALLARYPCRVVATSAANCLVLGNEEAFAQDERWLELELAACREPGALDCGTHIVVVAERM